MGERTMVERVARAICDRDPDARVGISGCTVLNRDGARKMETREVPAWRLFEARARAAIEAMREPSDAMVDEIRRIRGTLTMDGWERESIAADWRSMVDAAKSDASS